MTEFVIEGLQADYFTAIKTYVFSKQDSISGAKVQLSVTLEKLRTASIKFSDGFKASLSKEEQEFLTRIKPNSKDSILEAIDKYSFEDLKILGKQASGIVGKVKATLEVKVTQVAEEENDDDDVEVISQLTRRMDDFNNFVGANAGNVERINSPAANHSTKEESDFFMYVFLKKEHDPLGGMDREVSFFKLGIDVNSISFNSGTVILPLPDTVIEGNKTYHITQKKNPVLSLKFASTPCLWIRFDEKSKEWKKVTQSNIIQAHRPYKELVGAVLSSQPNSVASIQKENKDGAHQEENKDETKDKKKGLSKFFKRHAAMPEGSKLDESKGDNPVPEAKTGSRRKWRSFGGR